MSDEPREPEEPTEERAGAGEARPEDPGEAEQDEHDDDEILIREGEKGALVCDARAEIDDIREALNGRFDVGEHDEDAETIGGVIFSVLGRVPVKGEVIEAFGYEFRVRDADPRRIRTVEILPSKKLGQRKSIGAGSV